MGDIDNRKGYSCMGAGNIGKRSVPSPSICCEHKTPLKIKSIPEIRTYINTLPRNTHTHTHTARLQIKFGK